MMEIEFHSPAPPLESFIFMTYLHPLPRTSPAPALFSRFQKKELIDESPG